MYALAEFEVNDGKCKTIEKIWDGEQTDKSSIDVIKKINKTFLLSHNITNIINISYDNSGLIDYAEIGSTKIKINYIQYFDTSDDLLKAWKKV